MEKKKGRKPDQKMKPFLVYQYLLRNTDENHSVSASEIVDYINGLGIAAERKSIYKDIAAINDALWLLENYKDLDLEDGFDIALEEAKEEGYYEETIQTIRNKGYYVSRRKYEAADIRLISECIYSSRYISQKEAERLVKIMKEFVSDNQADQIKTDALVSDRVRTLNKATLGNISTLNDAMSKMIYGEPHVPEKVSFKYLKYTISDINQQVERRKGITYIVSPYKLLINNGNYYLLAFSDEKQKIMTYRVDRMKDLRRLGIERDGAEEFKKIDLKTYTQRTFSMFNGKKERVTLRFRASLLDTAIERFGRTSATYIKSDEHHFTVSTEVEISDQFFGWLCGFGIGVQIFAPESVREKFKAYVDKISSKY